MASAGNDTRSSTPSSRHHNRECPVCFREFRVPKMLQCGHSICADCTNRLKTAVDTIECPVCRAKTNAVGGLPTNFALQSLIEESNQEKYRCEKCARRNPLEDMWSCKQCGLTVACANCIVKNHRDHDVQGIKDLMESRQSEFEAFRRDNQAAHGNFMQRQAALESSLRQTLNIGHRAFATLQSKLLPMFNNAIRNTTSAGDTLLRGVNERDLSNLTVSGQYEVHLNNIPLQFEKLADKQERIKRDIEMLNGLVKNTAEVMQRLAARLEQCGVGAVMTEENARQTNGESGGAVAENRRSVTTENSAQGASAIDWPFEEVEVGTQPQTEYFPQRHINALPSIPPFSPSIEDEISIDDSDLDDGYIAPRQEQFEDVRRVLQHLHPSAVIVYPRIGQIRIGGIGRGQPVNDSGSLGLLGGVGRGMTGRGRGRGMPDNFEWPGIGGMANRARSENNESPDHAVASASFLPAFDNGDNA